jgi:hypothetical protein
MKTRGLDRWFSILLVSVCSVCSVVNSASAQAKITYDEHVLPFFKGKCIGCHNQDKKRGGLVLNNYTRVMEGGSSGAAVKAGDPDNSLLYKAIAHTSEPFMPPRSPKVPQAMLDLVRKWIAGGAPENAGSKVVVPDKPKVDFTLPSVAKGKPAGPPPMPPKTLRLEPVVRAARDTAVTALASSPWAPLLALGGQKQVLLYHSDSLELLGVLPFPEGTPNVLKFSRNGSLLIAGGGQAGKSGRVVVWSVTKGERLMSVGEESDSVLAADVSPDQTRIALGGPGKVVRIYSTRDGKLQHEIRKHTDWVTALEYSPDGVLLATGDRNGGLFVWEAFSAREYFTLKGHTAAISEITWRADSNVVASGSEDGTIRLYEMENGNQIRGWNAHGGVRGVRYGRDGKIISTGRDRVTRLWDGNGTAQRAFEPFPDVGLCCTFSHDGGRVIAGDWTGQVVVWNTADGKRIGTISSNPPGVREQLLLAQKTVTEKQKSADTLAATAKASQAAFVKATADLAAAQKAVGDTAAALKVAEQKRAQARAPAANAQAALRAAQAEVKAKETLSTALAEAAAKVKTEADKARDNSALAAAAKRAQALADQASAETTLARKALVDVSSAARTLESALAQAQQAYNTANAAAQAAPKNVAALQAALKTLQPKAAADKVAADKAAVELKQARAAVAKWQAAATALVKKTDR